MKPENNKQALNVNEAISNSEAFVIKYKKTIIIAAVAIFVVIGGFFAFKYGYLQPREEKASALSAQGLKYLTAGDFETALNGDKKAYPGYAKIASEYSITDAGNVANIYAGICYANLGKTKEAIKSFESFSTQGDETISPAALGALANCYATDGQVDKAIETFKKAADMADNVSLSPAFLIEAGKLLESQKKNTEALELYNQVKNDYPTCTQASPIQQNGMIIAPEIDKYIERVSQ